MDKKSSTRKRSTIDSTSLKAFLWIVLISIVACWGAYNTYLYRYNIVRWLKLRKQSMFEMVGSGELNAHDHRNKEILHHYSDYVVGVDISHYQDQLSLEESNWVYDDVPVRFVILRSTMGWNGKDKTFGKRWEELRRHRFVRGAYHFYRPDEPSTEQAYNFVESVKLLPGDLPPILDIESLPKVQGMDRLKEGLKNWLSIVENHYGVKPIIYSGQHFYENYLENDFNEYPVWVANYNRRAQRMKDHWWMWQFTEKGKVKGIKGNVDVNVFNGDWNQFESHRIKTVRIHP